MPRNYDKIQLPTSITQLETIARMTKVVMDNEPLSKVKSKPLFMAAKANGLRGKKTQQETHTESTLAGYGLIEYLEDNPSLFRTTQLGRDLVQLYSTYSDVLSMPVSKKQAISLSILYQWHSDDGGRDIHPGRILLRLLLDPKLDGYLTDHEFTVFLLDPEAKTDGDYDSIRNKILAFRSKGGGALCLEDVNKCKTYLFLPAFTTLGSDKQRYARWGILDRLAEYSVSDGPDGFQWNQDSEEPSPEETDDVDGDDENDEGQPPIDSSSQQTDQSPPIKLKYTKVCKYSLNPIAKNILKMHRFLAAVRTKPFILLAGISGTGKSRLVRQLARGCCPRYKIGTTDDHLLYNEQKPGNFEMIQVRPNWHDSTELIGYVSRITRKSEYQLTDFVRFLAKAWVFPDIPFFLCLDEMNLAPVEQYFAEFLSVIETRSSAKEDVIVKESGGTRTFIVQKKDEIRTDVLVKFAEADASETVQNLLKEYWDDAAWSGKVDEQRVQAVRSMFEADKGVRIPPNFVVMGTVNMDETTCSFSRKVLDRAMSFELNEVDMDEGLKTDNSIDFNTFAASEVTPTLLCGHDAWQKNQPLCEKVKDYLVAINNVLDKTPFKIAYRSRDEIMVYCIERTRDCEDMLAQALDEATSMKILSRIEGDNQHVKEDWLAELEEMIGNELAKLPGFDKDKNTVCSEKLDDMIAQAAFGYTSFWLR